MSTTRTVVQEQRIECHTGLGPNTPVIVEGEIMTMGQVHLGYSGKRTKTLGIDVYTDYTVKDCGLTEVPQELYVYDTIKIKLASGFYFECSIGSQVATPHNGVVRAETLEVGSEVYQIIYNADNGRYYYNENTVVESIDKTHDELKLATPVYLFISEFNNILLPYKPEGESNITKYIIVQQ